ncbi:MAG TPA: D-alanyl-D-alanine carboxypeptidase family protein [Solirubrobacteraceae bacterium]|nr:D-alanyl-D-alanine carboxypeptidase family protein [Solirubrobacteraceae bacterium]
MSFSPFLTPDRSRRRSALAARRRRRRRVLAAVLALAVVATAIVFGAMALASRSGRSHRGGARATIRATAIRRAPRQRSPYGFPLARPALALSGIATPAQNPVQISFRDPPREGLLFNLSTGQVLWQHNAYERVPIASLTKMMTALLTVQSSPPDAPVLVTREAVDADGSKVGVLPLGRHVPLESMLYGLLLPSGNDAAVALAQHVAGSVNRFVVRMNQEAAKLGLGCTRYSSPSGYYDAGNYSCAADLAVLTHMDMAQPRIARIVHTYSAVLPFPIKGGKLYLYNNNPLLIYRYPGVTGMKTGQTEAAGRCLVATAERHGVRLGAIVLNSDAPGTQARELLDLGFEHVYHQPIVPEEPFPPGA